MSRFISFLFLTGLLVPAPALAQAEPAPALDLSGAWVFTVQSPNGTGTRQVTLTQEGDSISGTISSSRASGEFTGVLEGGRLTFTVVLAMDSGPFPVIYDATIVGDEMEGTVDYGDYGLGTFTGRRVDPVPGAREAAAASARLPNRRMPPPSPHAYDNR